MIRFLAAALFLAVFAVTAVLPVGTLALVSLAPTLLAAKELDFAHLGLQHYQTIRTDPVARRAIQNTVVLALLGATTAMGLGFVITYVTTRSRLPARGLVEYVLFLPFAPASVVLAVGILWGYVRFPITIYGTIWILLIGAAPASTSTGSGGPRDTRLISATPVQASDQWRLWGRRKWRPLRSCEKRRVRAAIAPSRNTMTIASDTSSAVT